MIYPQRVGFFLHLQDLINDYLVGKSDLVGIEIGSYAGESASMFLKSNAFKKLYCIDPWLMGYDPLDPSADKTVYEAEIHFDYKHFLNPIVKKLKMFSEDAVSLFEDESIDFIYIDGCHTYEAVKRDLNNYFPKIKIGGIIAGHDYVDPGPDKPIHIGGVKTAVDEFFGVPPISRYEDFSWVHIKNKKKINEQVLNYSIL